MENIRTALATADANYDILEGKTFVWTSVGFKPLPPWPFWNIEPNTDDISGYSFVGYRHGEIFNNVPIARKGAPVIIETETLEELKEALIGYNIGPSLEEDIYDYKGIYTHDSYSHVIFKSPSGCERIQVWEVWYNGPSMTLHNYKWRMVTLYDNP